MNPLNRLLGHLHLDGEDRELTPAELAEQEAEAKKARIKYHRDNVRNGPVKYRSITTGMQRRAHQRAQAAQQRKTNRRYRRAWMDNQAHVATLRGHLIILGVIECKNADTVFTPEQTRESCVWVIRKYGERDDSGELVEGEALLPNAIGAARDAFLTAMGVTDRPDIGEDVQVVNRPSVTA